jgi:tRNA-uridine 2-sulfurtransferase
MSGGVDSSLSATLLKERGYEVEGAFIVTWTAPWLPCTWREERLDAMRVAEQLHIPFHTIDLSKEYEREVVDYMVQAYRAGHTPNPDVMCNKYIKFGGFYEFAMAQGFDYVATGHYAQVQSMDRVVGAGEAQGAEVGALQQLEYMLLAGADTNKDQSYFLWTLTQAHLAHTLFPVGMLEKPEVRRLALTKGLETAQKKDSQGICFLGKVDMREFLSHYITAEEGVVLDTDGVPIGAHKGAVFYTIGQRHGFTINHTNPHSVPLYVIAKDVPQNTLTVAPFAYTAPNTQAERITLTLKEVNWISGHLPTEGVEYVARFRYRQALVPASIHTATEHTAHLTLMTRDHSVALGQSCVLYRGDECVGGGVVQYILCE